MDALPFSTLEIVVPCLPGDYPYRANTIADHLRKRRYDLKLLQKEVADMLGISEDCLRNWEKGRFDPMSRYHCRIIGFLGYDPFN